MSVIPNAHLGQRAQADRLWS